MMHASLDDFIARHKLQKWEQLLRKHHRPCYIFKQVNEEDYAQTGNSRMGGWPDLPAHVAYPVNEKNEFLRLIIQVNLSELTVKDPLLPAEGMIWLFEGDFEETPFQVLYEPSTQNLVKKTPDEALQPCSSYDAGWMDDQRTYGGVKVKSAPSWHIEYQTTLCGGLEKENRDAHFLLFENETDDAQMLGSYRGGGSPQELAWLAFNGFGHIMYTSFLFDAESDLYASNRDRCLEDNEKRLREALSLPDSEEKENLIFRCREYHRQFTEFDSNRMEYIRRRNEVTLLFAIGSISRIYMEWNDMRTLSVFIRKEDLAKLDFSNLFAFIP